MSVLIMKIWSKSISTSTVEEAAAVVPFSNRKKMVCENRVAVPQRGEPGLGDSLDAYQLTQELKAEKRQDEEPFLSEAEPRQKLPSLKSSSFGKKHKGNTEALSMDRKGSALSRILFHGKDGPEHSSRDQVKVIYRQFGPNAEEVLTVEHEAGGMPSPEEADHVVIKIQVSRRKKQYD